MPVVTKFIVAAAIVLVGCTDGLLPDQSETFYFSSLETRKASPEEIPDRGPQLSKSQADIYEPILEGFERNHKELLARSDIRDQIERIESVYVSLGRYVELVAMLQKDVEEKGAESHVIDRLAWGYIRLGMQNYARELLDQLQQARPQSADVWFLEGAFWLQWDSESTEARKNFVAAWERAVDLDPNYRGYEGITAENMKQQIERVRRLLGPDEPASPEERAFELASEAVQQAPRLALAKAVSNVVDAVDPNETDPDDTDSVDDNGDLGQEPAPERNAEREYALKVAQGNLYLSENKPRQAEDAFIAARTIKPQGFEAEFGQFRAGWGAEGQRNRVAAGIRGLAQRDDLTARQAYEVALFARSKMADKDLARELLERSQKLDPELAQTLNIQSLIDKL